jgi:hypothetical protein
VKFNFRKRFLAVSDSPSRSTRRSSWRTLATRLRTSTSQSWWSRWRKSGRRFSVGISSRKREPVPPRCQTRQLDRRDSVESLIRQCRSSHRHLICSAVLLYRNKVDLLAEVCVRFLTKLNKIRDQKLSFCSSKRKRSFNAIIEVHKNYKSNYSATTYFGTAISLPSKGFKGLIFFHLHKEGSVKGGLLMALIFLFRWAHLLGPTSTLNTLMCSINGDINHPST